MNARAPLPPPNTDDVLNRRFSLPGATSDISTPVAHVAHRQTGKTRKKETRSVGATSTTSDTRAMTRRSFYLSAETADALAGAANKVHHDSNGAIPKHAALDAIIRAGLKQLPDLAKQLRESEQNQ